MSQNWIQSPTGNKVLYGIDLPTGGCFWTEFLKDSDEDEVVCQRDGITLTQLVNDLLHNFDFNLNPVIILMQLEREPMPTQLQYRIAAMFGKNLSDMLRAFSEDLQENYSEYLVK